jgi:hypothetical protein
MNSKNFIEGHKSTVITEIDRALSFLEYKEYGDDNNTVTFNVHDKKDNPVMGAKVNIKGEMK